MQLSPELFEELTGICKVKLEEHPHEKRGAMRFPLGRRVMLLRKGGNATATVREISANGVNVMLPCSLRMGEEFIICFPRPKGSPIPIRCSTVRCTHGGSGEMVFVVGAKFQEVLRSPSLTATQSEDAEVLRIRQALLQS